MAQKKKMKDLPKSRKPVGDNADLLDLFDQADAKARERDGLEIKIGGKVFELWPAQIEYRERQQLWHHTGMTPNDAAMMMAAGQGSLEAIAAVIAMAMFQMYNGLLPDMNKLMAWVEQEVFSDDEIGMEVNQLKFDEQDMESDPEE